MDGLFNVWGFGMERPEEREKKRGIFWANRDSNQIKRKDTGINFLDMGEGTGSQVGMDTKTGTTIMPSDPRYQTMNSMQMQKQATPFHPGQGGNYQGGNYGAAPGTPGGWDPGARKDGGRIGYANGGLASLFTRRG